MYWVISLQAKSVNFQSRQQTPRIFFWNWAIRWISQFISHQTQNLLRINEFTYALSAPPPFACPSSFVMMTDATSTFSLKARAYTPSLTSDNASVQYLLQTGSGSSSIFFNKW